ncbi:MAG: hypothetical protein WDW36_008276 [Sanguina aurantia]
MRICVLHPSYALSDSEMKELDPDAAPDMYDTLGAYNWTHVQIHKATATKQVRDLSRQGFDVFFNLCDGAFDEDRAGKEVVEALERYNCAYTGANLPFYEPSKELMKKMAYYYDIPVPAWAFVYTLQDLTQQVAHLRYPLIVKHYNGYSSVGMSRDSKVDSPEALQRQVSKTLASFGGALVEEYIAGREFTVLVAENPDPELMERPLAFLPVECKFGAGETFKHFDLKWRDFDSMQWVPCPDSEPELCSALKAAACSAFAALKGVSYGRCDFRVDEKGDVFFLEINPNCGIFYPPAAHGSADYILTIDPSTSHAAFIDQLVACALARHRARQKHTVERFLPGSGYGLYAAAAPPTTPSRAERVTSPAAAAAAPERQTPPAHPPTAAALPLPDPDCTISDHGGMAGSAGPSVGAGAAAAAAAPGSAIGCGAVDLDETQKTYRRARHPLRVGHGFQPGELVVRYEEQTHNLVTRDYARAAFPPGSRQAGWFAAYAYPITDNLFVTWSEDPDRWVPLNHSCDPNSWTVGLDLVARRFIPPGEQITIDYAACCVENLAEFECRCGAATCRKLVSGRDHLAPWVDAAYAGHLSEAVERRRKEMEARA